MFLNTWLMVPSAAFRPASSLVVPGIRNGDSKIRIFQSDNLLIVLSTCLFVSGSKQCLNERLHRLATPQKFALLIRRNDEHRPWAWCCFGKSGTIGTLRRIALILLYFPVVSSGMTTGSVLLNG